MCICMCNLNPAGRLLLLAVLTVFSIYAVDSCGGGVELQWQILTKLNYTSQIRLHPHLLLLVTIPWSGESRSLMKELTDVVANDDARFGTLKLMVLYKNVERMLADALGATDEITFFYFHNSLSYKYKGRFRVQSILSSVQYVMSFTPDELPFKSLTTPEELKDFSNSTGKAIFLLEFCGWTPRLLAMKKTVSATDLGKDNLGAGFDRENNGTLMGEENNDMKGMESDSCGIGNGFSGIWTDQFALANDSLVKEAEMMKFTPGDFCTLYEFQQFELFFEKVLAVAREFFLPPERFRFAAIHERSLLPWLHIQEPAPWLISARVTGCPSCSKVLKEVDDLRNFLQTQVSPVLELEDAPDGAEVTLPAKVPALLLFVDRSSISMQTRRQSKEALEAFQGLAQHMEMSNQIRGQVIVRPDKSSTENMHPKLQPFSASQKLIIKDKMSVMVMNEGHQFALENIVSDFQGSSVQEILNYVLNQNKKLKLSAIAKEKGFQLLSNDFDVDDVESLLSPSMDQSNQGLDESVEGADDKDEKKMPAVDSIAMHEEVLDSSNLEQTTLKRKEGNSDKNSLSPVEHSLSHHGAGLADAAAQGWNDGQTGNSAIGENEQQEYFMGSFLLCDGQYRLLETLTGGLKVPSVVIVDPISQEHYVLSDTSSFNYSVLSAFVNDFLTGKLHSYVKSSGTVPSSRDGPTPPFVNLDFHETDSIPLVTSHTFSELVLRNKSDLKTSDHSQDRNVLVLFSNNWCGFCQRMELVVREVYRAVKAYASTKINSSRKDKFMLTSEYVEGATLKLPLIYMMDCTQNDCNSIIKPIGQRELYPLLLLFPADRKDNVMLYEGDIVVSDIIKFLAAHGSDVLDLIMDKSLLQGENLVGQLSTTTQHEVLLKDRVQIKSQINAQLPANLHERPQLVPGSILTASDKLLDAHPFEHSKILILTVDQTTGFHGLIFNKHISWDAANEFVQGFEFLNRAPLSFGGPVVKRGMPLIALTRTFIEGRSVEVLPNVYFLDQSSVSAIIEEIKAGNRSLHDYWFFLGYSSWGWEQLFLEIAQGAWNVSQGSIELLEWP